MRTLISKSTINDFKTRFEAFHDAILVGINYDFDAKDADKKHLHRVSVKINTPDWTIKPIQYPLVRINLLLEFEGIDYILLRKPEDRFITRIDEIDLQLTDNKVIADFLPYYPSNPMRGSSSIHKHYEENMASETNSMFVLIAKNCYWSLYPDNNS